VAVVAIGLMVPRVALAQSPTQGTSGDTLGNQQQLLGRQDRSPNNRQPSRGNPSEAATAKARSPVGDLPFTGPELGAIGFAGLGLVGTGFAIRRASRIE
jgi:hypothetical protein